MLSQAQGRKRSRRPPARPRGEQRCTEQGDTIPLRSHAGEPSPEMGAAVGRQLTFTASLEGAEQSKAAHSAEAELAGLWQLRTSAMNSSTHEWEGLGKRSPLQRPPGNCSPLGLRPLNHGKCTNSHCKGSKKNDVRRGAGSRVLFQEGISASVAVFPKLVPSPLLFPSHLTKAEPQLTTLGSRKGQVRAGGELWPLVQCKEQSQSRTRGAQKYPMRHQTQQRGAAAPAPCGSAPCAPLPGEKQPAPSSRGGGWDASQDTDNHLC